MASYVYPYYPTSIAEFTTKINKNTAGESVGPEWFNIPTSSPYQMYLDHVPKDSATTVVGASGAVITPWTQVYTTPSASTQFLVNYTTGLVTFHSSNSGAAVGAQYLCLGDDVLAEHMNAVQEEIIAIEENLGLGLKGGYSSLSDRLNSLFNQGGDLYVRNIYASGNVISLDNNGPDMDQYFYFYDTPYSQYLKWNDASGRFELSDRIYINGGIEASGDITPHASGTGNVGTDPMAWASGCFDNLHITGNLYATYLYGDGSNLTNLPMGASGYSGYSGTSGAPGGTSGYSGYSSAVPGADGASGYSGYSGDSPGTSGFSGVSGYSGYSGVSGAPGGTSGYSGVSGYSGAVGGGAGAAFGTWSTAGSKLPNTVYQAATDGYVLAYTDATVQDWWHIIIEGYTDSSNPPITKRLASGPDPVQNTHVGVCFTMPVRKNDYWKVASYYPDSGSLDSRTIVYWIPGGGASGYSGYSGLNGASVASGYSGYSGYSSTSGYSGYSGWSGAGVLSPGTIVPYAGLTAPAGYLLCDGSSYDIASYPDLYNIIGTYYGNGNNTLLIHANGINGSKDIQDSGNTGHVITRLFGYNGTGNTSNKNFKFGSSSIYCLASSGACLKAPVSSDWNFGTGDFTIDFWLYMNTISDSFLFQTWSGGAGNYYCFFYGSAYQLQFNSVSGDYLYYTFNKAEFLNKWAHIAYVRESGTLTVYVNGTARGSVASDDDLSAPSENFRVSGNESSAWLNGYIDEFRVSKGVARWSADFTPPTSAYASDSYTKLLIHGESLDVVGNKPVNFINSATLDTSEKKFGSASLKLTGSSDVASVGYDYYYTSETVPVFGTSPFTIDFWIKYNSVAQSTMIGQGYYNGSCFWHLYYDGAGSCGFHASSSYGTMVKFEITYTPDTSWHHIALVRIDGGSTSSSWRFFVDGVPYTLTKISGLWSNPMPDFNQDPDNYSKNIDIGGRYSYGYVNGWMDEIRISNTARWTADFSSSLPTDEYAIDTFCVPDLRGKTIVSKSNEVEFAQIGLTGGEKTHLLTAAEIPANSTDSRTVTSYFQSTAISTHTGSASTAHNNLQPYLTMNYIIKT